MGNQTESIRQSIARIAKLSKSEIDEGNIVLATVEAVYDEVTFLNEAIDNNNFGTIDARIQPSNLLIKGIPVNAHINNDGTPSIGGEYTFPKVKSDIYLILDIDNGIERYYPYLYSHVDKKYSNYGNSFKINVSNDVTPDPNKPYDKEKDESFENNSQFFIDRQGIEMGSYSFDKQSGGSGDYFNVLSINGEYFKLETSNNDRYSTVQASNDSDKNFFAIDGYGRIHISTDDDYDSTGQNEDSIALRTSDARIDIEAGKKSEDPPIPPKITISGGERDLDSSIPSNEKEQSAVWGEELKSILSDLNKAIKELVIEVAAGQAITGTVTGVPTGAFTGTTTSIGLGDVDSVSQVKIQAITDSLDDMLSNNIKLK